MPRVKHQNITKVQALTRYIQDGEPISSICGDLRISPLTFENWRKELVGGLAVFFDQGMKKEERQKEREINSLKAEVLRKQELIGEIMEAYTVLKKKNGVN